METAFPTPDIENRNGDIQYGSSGMTLRDYFAAKALQALIHETHARIAISPAMVAEEAYGYADAMLDARER